jgi:DNA polymerase-3 subunit gamma/tau
MQYQALYRKYRPQRFDEVVGQDHVTTTLAREVVDDKVSHAYLFTGPRGTGKTTSARLLAKSLNCPNRTPDGEPCNACPSCEGITDGTSLDVIELDAASHNKVEDVREIRVNVGTVAAAAGARRVYILDEAHMLSRAAGNALLKTLEEPPEHVVFVLATTEPYKLLDTIRSRAQRFDFHPVASETLIDYLAEISDREGFSYDHAALAAAVAHAGGSVRDAMSLLEQVAALGAGSVTQAGVEQALGLADGASYRRLVETVVAADPAAGLTLISEISRQGADLRRFVADAVAYLRGVFLAQYAPNIDDIVDASRETVAEWQQVAQTISPHEVLRAIDELSESLLRIREGREERLVVELMVLRLTKPEVVDDLDALSARVARMERQVKGIEKARPPVAAPPAPSPVPEEDLDPDRPFTQAPVAPVAQTPDGGQPEAAAVVQADSADEAIPTADTAVPSSTPISGEAAPATGRAGAAAAGKPVQQQVASFTLADFERVWPAVVAAIRTDVGPRRHALLREATPSAVEQGTVIFEVAAHMHFHLEQLKADDELNRAMCVVASEELGQPVLVSYRSADAPANVVNTEPERAPDKDELVEAASDDAVDPADTVLDILGGEIIQETTTE